MAKPIPIIEEWEILDKKIVGSNAEGSLQWWLIADSSAKGSTWHPFKIDLQGRIVQAPSWAPLPGAQQVALSAPVFELLMGGNRGSGKGLPIFEPVLTPDGFRAIGILQEGDLVCAPDGSPTKVTGVFPQGIRPCYELQFDDGSKARCDDQHLWAITEGHGRHTKKSVVPMRVLLDKFQSSKVHTRIFIPVMSEPAAFTPRSGITVDPYLVGLLLGDGSLTQQMRFTTMDDELARYVVSQGFRYQGNNGSKADSYWMPTGHPVAKALEDLGLRYKRAHEKSVPKQYLIASSETRLAILQGLLDTDGHSCKGTSAAEFSSTSEKLAEDVKFLALSLGAKVHTNSKIPTLNGKPCRRAWIVRVQPGGKFIPFRLQRKIDAITKFTIALRRRLVSITSIGDKVSTCISIAHPDGLFVTRDFVVTHNSEVLLMDYASEVDKGWGSAWRGILFRKQLGDLDEMVRKAETLFNVLYGDRFRFLHSKSDYRCVWDTGEELLFRHLMNIEEYGEYHGHQYPWIGFEELTQWEDDKPYRKMFSCCRPTAQGIPTRVRSNCNPSGVGHSWIKKRFRLPAMYGRIIRNPGEEARVAIKLDLKENFVLLHGDPGYINRIRQAASSPAEAKAWAEGDWDVTFGGMFDDLWDAKTHVIPDLRPTGIPRGWTISRSYDHGQSHPFAVLWWAESNGEPIRLPDGRLIGQVRGDLVLFKEWYGSNGEENTGLRMLSKKIAEGIRDRQNDMGIGFRVNAGPADTEIWTKRDTGNIAEAPIDNFESILGPDCWEKADKSPGSRVRGWQLIREYLGGAKPGPDGTRGEPGLFVCQGCTYWIELVPSAGRDPANQDEVPKGYEDHLGDATRYRLGWTHSFAKQSSMPT